MQIVILKFYHRKGSHFCRMLQAICKFVKIKYCEIGIFVLQFAHFGDRPYLCTTLLKTEQYD